MHQIMLGKVRYTEILQSHALSFLCVDERCLGRLETHFHMKTLVKCIRLRRLGGMTVAICNSGVLKLRLCYPRSIAEILSIAENPFYGQ